MRGWCLVERAAHCTPVWTWLLQIHALYPDAKLVLRIQTRDSGARCPLGSKYGALPEEVDGLLAAAAQRNLNVVGVSFHVGSGAADASAYHSAISAAHEVFQAAASAGRPMSLLDIGGGFTAPRQALGPSSPKIHADNAEDGGPQSMSFKQATQGAADKLKPCSKAASEMMHGGCCP